MPSPANAGIVENMKQSGVYQYEIAYAMNKSEQTLIRWLRQPLTEDRKAEILAAIERIKKERDANAGSA